VDAAVTGVITCIFTWSHSVHRFIHISGCRSLAAVLIVGLLPISAAHAELPDPRCDVRSTNSEACLDSGFIGFPKDCPKSGGWGRCDNPVAPPVAELMCEAFGDSVQCEAWPQSNDGEYTYYWTAEHGVSTPFSVAAHDPMGYAECTRHHGVVRVTVVGPTGLSDTETAMVNCNDQ
jgi:hypothetical protein